MPRNSPYGSFNYLVSLPGTGTFGGFSDVSGLSSEITAADYRAGTDPENRVRGIRGVHKFADVTLKRGLVSSAPFWQWITDTQESGGRPLRDVVVTLLDEARQPVRRWRLHGVTPKKYTGPTLAGKGGGDVAMEELVLSADRIDVESP